MTAATAPRPWPVPAAGTAAAGWRFARALDDGAAGLQWVLKRNCSITPAQLFGTYLALCAVSLTVALGFTWHGASPVLAFAGIELLLGRVEVVLEVRRVLVAHHAPAPSYERLAKPPWTASTTRRS